LHRVAQAIGLGGFLRLGEGELKSGGSARPSILADAVEALVGAIYVDGGFEAARQALRGLLAEPLSIRTVGVGSSRRAAEQEAAQRAFEELGERK
jgi:dsRNA-specific ribonuclease